MMIWDSVRWLLWRLGIVFGLAVIIIYGVVPPVLAYVSIYQLTQGAPCHEETPLTDHLPTARSLTLTPETNVNLDAWYVAGTNGAGVVISGGAFHSRDGMWQEAQILHQAGYSVLTYDTRSCANPKRTTTLGYTEKADLKAALDYMAEQPEVESGRIGAFGFSMGGAIALMGAAEDTRIAAVAASGNYADMAQIVYPNQNSALFDRILRIWVEWSYEWQTGVALENLSPVSTISQISPRPVFLIHGTNEDLSGAQVQYEAAGEPKSLWIVPDAGHGNYADADWDGYASRLVSFFDESL